VQSISRLVIHVKPANCLIIIVTEDGIVASEEVLPMEGSMTRGGILEYTEALRDRYLGASKKEKGRECGNKSEFCYLLCTRNIPFGQGLNNLMS